MASMIKRLWNDRRGASAWVVMVAMVPLLGMVSLGTEVGSWHVTRRHAQNAADAAAIAGATALAVNDPTGPVTAGQAFANSNGFVTGGGCLFDGKNRSECLHYLCGHAARRSQPLSHSTRSRSLPNGSFQQVRSRYRPQQLPKYKQSQGTVCSHSVR